MANQKYKFERLTPIDNMDLDVYEEAIDYVFSNSDVKNVAISGAYSAGKSSVLASYKKKHGELRFLHISLAHFKSTDQKSNAEVKESTLEGKILNQLIHQIPSEKIPQTNFRVKKTVSSKSIVTSTICAVLFLISIIHLLFFSVWKNYVSFLPVSLIKSILMPSTHPFIYRIYSGDSTSFQLEKDALSPEKYESGGTTYYIMSNMDDYFVTWLSENIECTISGISTHDEALKMITSLNQS